MAQKKKIAEKADKRRRAKVVVGHDADGIPVIKYASGKNQRELEAAKAKLKKSHIAGERVNRSVLFSSFADEWLEVYKRPKVKLETYDDYAGILRVHLLPAFGERQLGAIQAVDLQKLLNAKAENGCSQSLLTKIYQTAKQLFRCAYGQRVIDYNPTETLYCPSGPQGQRRALTDDERDAVLAVGMEHREGLLLLLLYYTGVRIGEALGLQWGDIDFKSRVIHIQRDVSLRTGKIDTVKSTAADRYIPLLDELYEFLRRAPGIGQAHVIQSERTHSHVTKSAFVDKWNRLMATVYESNKSIEHTKPEKGDSASILTPHYFRHNYASVLYNAGVDVITAQKILGHKDIKTTLGIYSHLSEEKEFAEVAKIRDSFKRLPKGCQIAQDSINGQKQNPRET